MGLRADWVSTDRRADGWPGADTAGTAPGTQKRGGGEERRAFVCDASGAGSYHGVASNVKLVAARKGAELRYLDMECRAMGMFAYLPIRAAAVGARQRSMRKR